MNPITFSVKTKEYSNHYNKIDFGIWNGTDQEISEVRKEIRTHYLNEQSYRCAYCHIEKKESHGLTWDIEHILPKSKYPQFLFEPENLAIACKECNMPKDNSDILVKPKAKLKKLPKRKEDYKIVHPHFDVYSDNFEIIIVKGRRMYRCKNGHKARETYLACNFFRFDYQFGEWDDFNSAIVEEFSDFLDKSPKNYSPIDLKGLLGYLDFKEKTDF